MTETFCPIIMDLKTQNIPIHSIHYAIILLGIVINAFNLICIYIQRLYRKKKARYLIMFVIADIFSLFALIFFKNHFLVNSKELIKSRCENQTILFSFGLLFLQLPLHILVLMAYHRYKDIRYIDQDRVHTKVNILLGLYFQ